MKKRFIIFDLIRILAIGLIIFAHLMQTLGKEIGGFFGCPNFYFVSLGGVGVSFFLILSGMAMEAGYGKVQINYGKFLYKRVKRIYPVYWLGLLFALGLELLLEKDNNWSIGELILNFSGFQVFAGKDWGEFIIPVTWFIGLIFVFYVIYPWLSKWMKTSKNLIVIILLVVSVISRLFMAKHGQGWYRPLDWFPLCRIFEFSLGIWLIQTKASYTFLARLQIPSIEKITYFLAKISFPAFLIHYPLLQLVDKRVNWQIWVLLMITICLGWIITIWDEELQGWMSKKISNLKFQI